MSTSLSDQYPAIIQYLESIETEERIKCHPHLTERAADRGIDDIQHLSAVAKEKEDDVKQEGDDSISSRSVASIRNRNLKEFSLQLLLSISIEPRSYINMTKLDVSHNELSTLPGLASLSNLEILCIRRNWFNQLPSDIGKLTQLKEIDASRNFLKPNNDSLRLDELKLLQHLTVLDVSLNQKCRTTEHRQHIKNSLLPFKIDVSVTIWQEMSNVKHGNCIGSSAAQRNPNLLRSQIEPWGTVNLRRILVRDFGQEPTDPKLVDRAGVMKMLLRGYQKEGLVLLPSSSMDDHLNNNDGCIEDNRTIKEDDDLNMGMAHRRTIKIDGTLVREELLDEILVELRDWRGNNKRGGSSNNRERPSIKAECYMILCAPTIASAPEDGKDNKSRREKRKLKKMEGNSKLWNLALQAMKEVDAEFATRCSEIAVTFGFAGSPHIDRQNASPFYGLALGDFTEGTGCVTVECSPRVVAEVNTKNRLGRVDGRYPHWVGNYDVNEERFSLIYYDTLSAYQPPGPAIFKMEDSC